MDSPGGSDGTESVRNAGDPRFNPWVGKIPWRREWQPTLVFLLREFLGQRSLAGYSPWAHKKLDTTQQLSLFFFFENEQGLFPRQIWPWNTEWSRAKTNRVLLRKCTGHNKHPLPTTQEKTLHMDITRWSTLKSDWLYSLQPKMEKLYTVNNNKTRSWLWLRPWTPYCQIQT